MSLGEQSACETKFIPIKFVDDKFAMFIKLVEDVRNALLSVIPVTE